MKSYRISVNGQSYDVTVEELGAAAGAAPRPAPAVAPAAPRAAAPSAPASAAAGATAAGGSSIKAPMPGTLLSYKVSVGQAVKRGEVLLILEAMKMENEIVAPADGVVTALNASEGASVNTGDVLVELG